MKLINVLFFVLCLILSKNTFAWTGRASIGAGGQMNTNSSELNNQLPLVQQYGGPIGNLNVDLDLFYGLVLSGKFLLSFTGAKIQYDFTENSIRGIDNNLKATISRFQTSLGVKYNFFQWGMLRTFVGAYGIYGGMGVVYNEDNYKQHNLTTTGFKASDSSRYLGINYSAGFDICGVKSGVRFEVEKERLQTKSFQTIAGKNLVFNMIQFTIGYLETF